MSDSNNYYKEIKDLIESIAEVLKKNHWSVAAAESVTSGLLQAAFSQGTMASEFYQGGITAYNVGQKYRHLLIDPLHALACDSVSEKIAEEMSLHVCDMFGSTFGVATTGYAVKVPEKNIDKLFCFYAIASDKKIVDSGIINSDAEEGLTTQIFYTKELLQKFSDSLTK